MVTNKKLLRKMICLLMGAIMAGFLAGCSRSGPETLVEGARLMQEGRREDAMEKFQVAIQLMPTNAQAWNYLGVAYQQHGDFTNALLCYHTALKFNHLLNVVHYNIGCLYLEQNQPDTLEAAQTELLSFTTLQGHSLDGTLKLATVQFRLGKFVQSDATFREVLRMDPQNAEALNGLGMIQFQRRHYREALADFNLAIRARKDYAPALLNIAVTQASLNNRQQALKGYQDYLALNPRPPNWQEVNDAASQLAQELNPQSRPVTVEDSAKTTPPANVPQKPVATSSNGTKPIIATVYKTNQTATNRIVESGVAVDSRDVEGIQKSAGKTNKNLLQKLFSRSDKNTQTPDKISPGVKLTTDDTTLIVESTPKNVSRIRPALPPVSHYPFLTSGTPPRGDVEASQAFIAKGIEAQRSRRLKEAVTMFQSAAQSDPGGFDAQYGLGSAAYEAGDFRTAMRAYELAQKINPDSFKARYGFGLALKRGNYFSDSARQLERLIDSGPDDATPQQLAGAHLTLGNIYSEQFNDSAAARKHYLKVLELDPHNSQETAVRYWLQSNP